MRCPPPRRICFLLRLTTALALVSAGVNVRWWRQHARSLPPAAVAAETDAGQPGDRDAEAVRIEQAQSQAWINAHPDDVAARIDFARWLFIQRHFPEAEQQLALLKAQQPRRGEVDYWLSLVQQQRGHLEAALRSIQAARRLEPGNEPFREQAGEIYLAQGRSEEAAEVFDVCLKQRPDSFAALLGKARAMEQLYEAKRPVSIEEIVAPVRKAVGLQPQNPEGVTMLARMSLAYLQQLDAADQLANQAIRLDPSQAEPYLILAEIALLKPGHESAARAASCARQAARLAPRRPEPLYLLGRALLRQNDPAAAIAALERSRRIQMMPQAVYQLSLAYARAGSMPQAQYYSRLSESWSRFTEQRHLLLALLQHQPHDVALYEKLAELYLSDGAAEPARNWALKGLQLSPNDLRLRRLLAQASAHPAFCRESAEVRTNHEDTKTRRHKD